MGCPNVRYAVACRRGFTAFILAYVCIVFAFGGTSLARPAVCVAAGAIGALVLFSARRGKSSDATDARPVGKSRSAGPGRLGAVAEWIGFQLTLSLSLTELCLRMYASGTISPLVSESLNAYRLVPGKVYPNGLTANRFGYPGREFLREKQPGVRRIAALGDSFAVGPAVAYSQNYLHLLEQRLPRTEVYNFGVSATGPREYLYILEHDVWRFLPDFVLLSVFVGNDVTETLATPRRLDLRSHYSYIFARRAFALITAHCFGSTCAKYREAAGVGSPSPITFAAFREIEARRLEICERQLTSDLAKKWKRAESYLDGIIATCRRHDVALGVVLIPDEFQINPKVLRYAIADRGVREEGIQIDLPQKRLRAFFEVRNVSCLDLMPAFSGVDDSYAPCDTHWNAKGNRLASEEIAHWMSGQ